MDLLTRFFERFGFTGPLARSERHIWASARNLDDLGELTARWLTGELQSQPGYYGPVDVDEDDAPGLTDVLVGLNRSGFVTQNSQAGFDGAGYDGAHWRLRAAVVGFADDATVDRIENVLCGTRFDVVAHSRFGAPTHSLKTGWRRQSGVVVTTREGRTFTEFGSQLSAADIAGMYDGCSDEAIAAVCGAWQVTVYDPEFGPDDLWPTLATAMTSAAA